MRNIKEVLRLKPEGHQLSHQQIAAALGISKGVVTKYVGLATPQGWTGRESEIRMKPRWSDACWWHCSGRATMCCAARA